MDAGQQMRCDSCITCSRNNHTRPSPTNPTPHQCPIPLHRPPISRPWPRAAGDLVMLLLLLLPGLVVGVPVENGVEGEPEIACQPTSIAINFNT